jgi:hypothetical protein
MFSLMVFTFLVPVCSLSSNPASSFPFLHNLILNHKVCIQFELLKRNVLLIKWNF